MCLPRALQGSHIPGELLTFSLNCPRQLPLVHTQAEPLRQVCAEGFRPGDTAGGLGERADLRGRKGLEKSVRFGENGVSKGK